MTKETHNLACNDWHNDPPTKNWIKTVCVYIYIYSCLKKMRFFLKSFVTIGTLSTDLPPVLTFRFFGLKQTHRFQCLFHLPGGPELGPLAHAMYKALCFKRSFRTKKTQQVACQSFRWIGGVELFTAKKSYYCINIYIIVLLRTQVSMRFQ